jgi:hypothetical protein
MGRDVLPGTGRQRTVGEQAAAAARSSADSQRTAVCAPAVTAGGGWGGSGCGPWCVQAVA